MRCLALGHGVPREGVQGVTRSLVFIALSMEFQRGHPARRSLEARTTAHENPGRMKSYTPPKLRQVVTEAIFRRQRIVLMTVAVVLLLVAAATALMHRKYSAQAKLMVQNVRSNAPLNTSPTERLVSQQDVSVTEVNSEVDLLQSQAVARRALDQGASREADLKRPDSAKQAAAVLKLQQALTVEPVHQTSLINVSVLANSPQAAEAELAAVLNAYFEQRAGTGRASGAADFFAKQVTGKGLQLDADTKSLTDFEVAHGIADLDDQKKLQVQRMSGLEDQLNASEAALARNRSQVAAELRQLQLTPSRSRASERTITNQYSQDHLGSELIDLENRRAELQRRYAPSDRQLLEVNDKISTLQRGISAAREHPATEAATEVNPVWQTLTSSVATSITDASGMAAQRAELQRQRAEAKSRLAELQQATATYDELKRRLAQSQSDYQLYVQKRDESRVAEALDREKMFDVALVQPPMASYVPVRPRPLLYLAVGLVFALLLGVALALYADTSAEQVYTPAQLDAVTGVRTLATLGEQGVLSGGFSPQNRTELRRILVALGRASSAGEAMASGVAVAFTSALPGEGVSQIVRGLAAEAALQVESRVAVLDAQTLAARFEREGDVSFGMRHDTVRNFWVLREDDPAKAAAIGTVADKAAAEGERWLRSGTSGRFSARLKPLIAQAQAQFDYVLLDCPSLATSPLAAELDMCVDGYVGVAAAKMARKTNIESLQETLSERRAPLLGFVMNRRTYAVPGWLHRLMWSGGS